MAISWILVQRRCGCMRSWFDRLWWLDAATRILLTRMKLEEGRFIVSRARLLPRVTRKDSRIWRLVLTTNLIKAWVFHLSDPPTWEPFTRRKPCTASFRSSTQIAVSV